MICEHNERYFFVSIFPRTLQSFTARAKTQITQIITHVSSAACSLDTRDDVVVDSRRRRKTKQSESVSRVLFFFFFFFFFFSVS